MWILLGGGKNCYNPAHVQNVKKLFQLQYLLPNVGVVTGNIIKVALTLMVHYIQAHGIV
jgi:hypothetical protein